MSVVDYSVLCQLHLLCCPSYISLCCSNASLVPVSSIDQPVLPDIYTLYSDVCEMNVFLPLSIVLLYCISLT